MNSNSNLGISSDTNQSPSFQRPAPASAGQDVARSHQWISKLQCDFPTPSAPAMCPTASASSYGCQFNTKRKETKSPKMWLSSGEILHFENPSISGCQKNISSVLVSSFSLRFRISKPTPSKKVYYIHVYTHPQSIPIIPLTPYFFSSPQNSHPSPTCHPLDPLGHLAADFRSPCGGRSKSWAKPRRSWAAAVAGPPGRGPGRRNSRGDRPASRPRSQETKWGRKNVEKNEKMACFCAS